MGSAKGENVKRILSIFAYLSKERSEKVMQSVKLSNEKLNIFTAVRRFYL